MTLTEAREAAAADVAKYKTRVTIVHSPTTREDWETEDEAYGYCPTSAVQLMFGPGLNAGLDKEIETIEPKE